MLDRRRERGIDGSAVSALVPVLATIPMWILALAVFWWPIHVFWQVPLWAFAGGYLAAGAVMFYSPLQSVIVMRLLGARRATKAQAARLEPAWRSVAQQSHVSQRRFQLAVIESEELNAFACGGSLVVVTSYAIDTLPRNEMVGVLAHELAHHLGMHTVALSLRQWLSLPIFVLAEIGFFLQNVATAATSSFASNSSVLTTLGRGLGRVLQAFSWIFLAGLMLSNAIANTVGQRSELDADRRAVSMGFGRELAVALRRVAEEPRQAPPSGWRGKLEQTHPSPRTRLRRVAAQLRSDR